VWRDILPKQVNRQYQPPKMVLFSGGTRSGCGSASSAMGPFYCPLDQTVYLDLSFFQDMQKRFKAGGDFAYAYVIAHEVGHHIENQLGILPRVQQRQQEVSEVERNQLSVRVELMADCLAGVWAHHSQQRYRSLEQGDIEEAIAAAEAIGDDRLQRQSGGRVVPDSFTHGSSEQRVRWFMQGLKGGTVQGCDSFRASRL
jgi:predicted metalloprotease